jgi:hypothetical protein
MEGGGPIGRFLYEVGEMKIGSQMGKLIVERWRVHDPAGVQVKRTKA